MGCSLQPAVIQQLLEVKTLGSVSLQRQPLMALPCLPASPACPQVTLLRRLFRAALGEAAAKLVDINTIDGFQVGCAGCFCGRPTVFVFSRAGGSGCSWGAGWGGAGAILFFAYFSVSMLITHFCCPLPFTLLQASPFPTGYPSWPAGRSSL